ncbi:hypothetical protein ACFYRN_19015 [Streptomyces sp. NPDC005227]|uniref:hypothetical protein n=1 Tax=Streptomyces sp. NPDC005227 TaxID=3364707 RepID=UPI003696A71D
MSGERIRLDGDQAMAFSDAFIKRDDYINAELIHHLIDGGDRVALPGCPECNAPAEQVTWSTYEAHHEVDVDPCGHRFRVDRPVVRTTVGADGSITVEEWAP